MNPYRDVRYSNSTLEQMYFHLLQSPKTDEDRKSMILINKELKRRKQVWSNVKSEVNVNE